MWRSWNQGTVLNWLDLSDVEREMDTEGLEQVKTDCCRPMKHGASFWEGTLSLRFPADNPTFAPADTLGQDFSFD